MSDADRDAFRISGTIEEAETGRPLGALILRAFDRDLLFDDKLGAMRSSGGGPIRTPGSRLA